MPAMALSDSDRTRLARLLGMTGSQHDGEALNAARLAHRLIRERKTTWEQVISNAPEHQQSHHQQYQQQQYRREAPRAWRDCVRECQGYRDFLSDWEIQFLANVAKWRGALTPKQRSKLHDICTRLRVRGWE